jgi:four helix bundle protein
MRDFRQVSVWQKAHQLTLHVYKSVESFPSTEKFGLTSQITRAASSIGANIAEGCGRGGDAELCRFLRIAIGSAFELDNHLLLARDLGLLNADAYSTVEIEVREVQRMLGAFIRKIQSDMKVG